MSLTLFADHCVANSIIETLRGAGHKVFRLKDQISQDSSDLMVISKAQELDAVLLSLDSDFADIVRYPPEKFKGIIALQVRNHPEITQQIMNNLTDFLSSHSDMEYYKGKLLIVEAHRIRIRG